tara:strand:+ start:2881 stop:3519 length:639 start_codon:yes stop_codon:yes gene_type:complete
MKDIVFVIPARLESTRLKHKMLTMFDDEPLIRIVFDKVNTMGYDTFVITDSPKIADHIPSNNVIMSGEAENGTARIASFLNFLEEYQTIINIQGDMLDISYETVKPFIDRAKHDFSVYTGYTKGCKKDDVKVIHQAGKAMWFTREPISYGDRHVGIYMYRPQALCVYDLLQDEYPQENLEQNRFLGLMDVKVCEVTYDGREINTKEDLDGKV